MTSPLRRGGPTTRRLKVPPHGVQGTGLVSPSYPMERRKNPFNWASWRLLSQREQK